MYILVGRHCKKTRQNIMQENLNKSFQNTESNTLRRIDGNYIWNEIISVLNFEKGLFLYNQGIIHSTR